MIFLIACIDKNNGIGKNNELVIKNKKDMMLFKNITMFSNVVMGRETFESIGKLLPNRHNIILTKDINYKVEGATICNDINIIIESSQIVDYYIIGGESIYNQFIDYADVIYLTKFNIETDANKYFPTFDEDLYYKEEVCIHDDNECFKLSKYFRKDEWDVIYGNK